LVSATSFDSAVQPDPHKGILSIAFLLGTWVGEGSGHYPSIADFVYREETRFWHDGRPFLFYMQRTWSPKDETAMHTESGYWRPQRDGSIEVVIAHNFGIVEIQEGTIEGTTIDLRSAAVTSTTSAKKIEGLARKYVVDGDSLTYDLQMAYGEHGLQPHLNAELKRMEP
jgi:hypothetical protein